MARDRGCRIESVRRTGEVRVYPPAWFGGPSVRVNNRRTDASAHLVRLLHAIDKRMEAVE